MWQHFGVVMHIAEGYAPYWRAHGVDFIETEALYDPAGGWMFPVVQVVPPEGDAPFLSEFREVYGVDVEGEDWVTVLERVTPPS